MKLTTNINIGGSAFTIDQDAYAALEEYLSSIEAHLQASDSKDEIMQDIELRIAELFNEHLRFGHMEVVNLSMVNDVKNQLGSPETISGEQENTAEASAQDDAQAAETEDIPQPATARQERKKKLYRDIDSQKIGGVCSGLAAFLGIEAIWLRLAFVLAFFFYGTGFWTYLILWIIMPAANTSARRLEMQGIEPTAENIQQEVERLQAEGKTETAKKGDNSGCLQAILILLGVCIILPILFFFGIIFFPVLIASTEMVHTAFFHFGANSLGASAGTNIVMTICLLLAILIPVITLIIWACNRARKKNTSAATWIIALVLWVASIIGWSISGIHTLRDLFHNYSAREWFRSNYIDDETGEVNEEALSEAVETCIDSLVADFPDNEE